MADRWEYTTLAWELRGGRSHATFLSEIGALGAEGWEAVGITATPVAQPGYMVLLKRRVE